MKKYENLTLAEQEEIGTLFTCWLMPYSNDVVVRVMERAEEIINNDFSMNLLRELYQRDSQERSEFSRSIGMLFRDFNCFKEFDIHNNPLTHSASYRDVLYDMYIRR